MQLPVSYSSLKVIQWLLTSSCSSSRHFYPSLYPSFNNAFQKAVPTPDVTNCASLLRFIICRKHLSPLTLYNTSLFLIQSVQLIFSYPSPAPHYKTSQVFLIYFPKCPSFSTIPSYAPIVAIY